MKALILPAAALGLLGGVEDGGLHALIQRGETALVHHDDVLRDPRLDVVVVVDEVPGLGIGLPFTIALSASFLPCMSSDLTVNNS